MDIMKIEIKRGQFLPMNCEEVSRKNADLFKKFNTQ